MPHTLADLSGPREIPFLGSLTHMAEDPLAFVTRLNREHGGCVPFRIGPQQTILLTEPSLIEELLIKHRAACIKDPVTAGLSDLLGNGLLTAEGERWRRNRRLMAPNFQHRHLASLAATMVASTDTALSEVTAGELDVHDHMMDLTLDIATRTLFGTVLDDAARVGPLLEELMECFETEVRSWRRLLPRWVPTPLRRRTHANRAQLHEILGVIVSRKRAELPRCGGPRRHRSLRCARRRTRQPGVVPRPRLRALHPGRRGCISRPRRQWSRVEHRQEYRSTSRRRGMAGQPSGWWELVLRGLASSRALGGVHVTSSASNDEVLPRILYVDDEADLREIVSYGLAQIGGFSVDTAASGAEALSMMAESPPDLVLLDVMMPGLDGPTTLSHMRADPALAQIPVVFCTARVFGKEIEALHPAGALDVVCKPFRLVELARRLRELDLKK